MFSRLSRVFYSRVFIGLNIDSGICQLRIVRIKNNTIRQNIKTDIKTIDDSVPIEALKLITFYKKKYPYTYVGMISKTYNQGAIPTTDPKDFIKLGVNLQGYKMKFFDNSWCAYIKEEDCQKLVEPSSELERLDLLFSPFLPMYNQAKKEGSKTSLYILQEKKSICVIISDGKKVYYGGYFEIEGELTEANLTPQESSPMVANSSKFEDILDSLSDNLEDLEALDIDLLEEEHSSEEFEQHEKDKIEELRDFMRATTIVGILENVIQEHYNNAYYESNFIEQIVILDNYGITPDSIKHIKDSLMIETYVKPFSIPEAITLLMMEEFKRKTL